MTKDEMTTLLRSVSCDENTITAMGNAYELGFDQGANVAEVMKQLVEEAESVCNSCDSPEPSVFPDTAKFWALFAQLRAMQ
jgi:hypothetical protein